MTPSRWLRIQSVILLLFTAGHTLGTAAPRVRRGPEEAAVFAAMKDFHFPIMGFDRSHWDFYRGFALTISALMLIMAVVAWQLAAVSRSNPKAALPMAITLQAGCAGLLIVGCFFFFGAPILFSAIALVCASAAVVSLARASARTGSREPREAAAGA